MSRVERTVAGWMDGVPRFRRERRRDPSFRGPDLPACVRLLNG